MSASVGIGLFICLVIIVIVGVAFKCNTDYDIEYFKSKVDYMNTLYHSLDKRWGDMYDVDNRQGKQLDNIVDIIKKQQEEIKELRRMIEPKEEKKCCCGNCRFYWELNNIDSACLNVHVNNKHKGDSIIYAENRRITCGTIKCVKPNDCCEYYEPKEASDE